MGKKRRTLNEVGGFAMKTNIFIEVIGYLMPLSDLRYESV